MTFYATIAAGDERPAIQPPGSYLYPASSFALPRFKMRAPKLPPHCIDVAADCGGFVATIKWGDYRYTPAEYVAWLDKFSHLTWAASMDYCCEPAIAQDEDAIVRRQERTTEMAKHFWDTYRAKPWAWVPTIQGWHVEDYTAHARQLAPLIAEMRDHYPADSGWRVGIGTLCQRADSRMIREVARAVARELPGIPLHLWGVKLAALAGIEALTETVVSVDSAAWNGRFGKGCQASQGSGMTQREYGYKVSLPYYQRRFAAINAKPKQTVMDWGKF